MMKFAQALRRMRQEEKGFTLVELMVVVVIIGILAAVAIPKFSSIIDNSKMKADVATGKTLKDACDRWYTDKGTYPDGADAAAVSVQLVNENYLNAPIKTSQIAGQENTVFAFDATTGQVVVNAIIGSVGGVAATVAAPIEFWNSAT